MKTRNLLLASLPEAVLAGFAPAFTSVQFGQHEVVAEQEQRVGHVYFPESGMISLILRLSDGATVETGLVGVEGMVGLPLLLGDRTSSFAAVAQSSCTALRLGTAPFRQLVDGNPAFHALLLRQVAASSRQFAQLAACNAHHALDQRLARWLLTAADRLQSDELSLTHDLLATMLCVQRPAVTIGVRMVQQAGLIRSGRGRITITDRAGLRARCCECYGLIRKMREAALPRGAGQPGRS